MTKRHKVFWDSTWDQIEDRLKEVELASFRSDPIIMKRVSTHRKNDRDMWYGRCKKASIPSNLYEDTLVAKPQEALVGKTRDGVLYTGDSCRHACTVHYIKQQFTSDKPIRVLEVGSGYGSFIEHMFRQFDISEYHTIDAPVMQKLQEYYLGELGLLSKCIFYDCTAEVWDVPEVDLIVSINSLSEMVPDVVHRYTKLFAETLAPNSGVLYLQQRRNSGSLHLHTGWDNYGLGPEWELTFLPGSFGKGTKAWVFCLGRIRNE